MSSPIVVPFNFNPTVSEFRNASYTIPAGFYAYAEVVSVSNVASSTASTSGSAGVSPSTCTIDSQVVSYGGATLIQRIGSNLTVVYSIQNNGFVAVIDTNTAQNVFSGNFISSGNIVFQSGAPAFTFSVPAYAYIGSYTIYRQGTAAFGGAVGLAPINGINFKTWVPSGTIISGSGTFQWKLSRYAGV